MSAERADAYLAAKGFFPSRASARAAILAGTVKVDGHVIDKAGQRVAEGADVAVTSPRRFVSRGGEKLEGALEAFGLDVSEMRVLDAGASTGGFTDCLLSRGAATVVAVDVGYGQFAWKLRNDARVVLFERTNIRSLTSDLISGRCDMAVADLSFISLRLVLGVIADLVAPAGPIVVLFKPQFEAGKGNVGKGGIVSDPVLHAGLLEDFANWAEAHELGPLALEESRLRGADGNIEFWWYLASGAARSVGDRRIADVVAAAHEDGHTHETSHSPGGEER